MEVTECPEDRAQWKRSFDIYPVGLTEKLRVNLDLACECECEATEFEVRENEIRMRFYYILHSHMCVLC